jgi:hypothetical protein
MSERNFNMSVLGQGRRTIGSIHLQRPKTIQKSLLVGSKPYTSHMGYFFFLKRWWAGGPTLQSNKEKKECNMDNEKNRKKDPK